MKQQLTTYLSENGLFSESQFSNKRERSTEDAVALATNRGLAAKTERKSTGVVMVDMWKAFDRVKHSRLIEDLFSLGISGLAHKWFCSYQSECFQQIKIGDNLSSSTACSRGVSQGSVLGPILFIYTSTHKENYEGLKLLLQLRVSCYTQSSDKKFKNLDSSISLAFIYQKGGLKVS